MARRKKEVKMTWSYNAKNKANQSTYNKDLIVNYLSLNLDLLQ